MKKDNRIYLNKQKLIDSDYFNKIFNVEPYSNTNDDNDYSYLDDKKVFVLLEEQYDDYPYAVYIEFENGKTEYYGDDLSAEFVEKMKRRIKNE